jgi:hypothetical protein
MSNDFGQLECRICGRAIYFPLTGAVVTSGERLIELTCSRGHTDSYWDVESDKLEVLEPVGELARAAAVGF